MQRALRRSPRGGALWPEEPQELLKICIQNACEVVEEWSGAQAIKPGDNEDEETRTGWQEVEATVLGRLLQVRTPRITYFPSHTLLGWPHLY